MQLIGTSGICLSFDVGWHGSTTFPQVNVVDLEEVVICLTYYTWNSLLFWDLHGLAHVAF